MSQYLDNKVKKFERKISLLYNETLWIFQSPSLQLNYLKFIYHKFTCSFFVYLFLQRTLSHHIFRLICYNYAKIQKWYITQFYTKIIYNFVYVLSCTLNDLYLNIVKKYYVRYYIFYYKQNITIISCTLMIFTWFILFIIIFIYFTLFNYWTYFYN